MNQEKKILGGRLIQSDNFISLFYEDEKGGEACFKNSDPKLFDKIESIKDFEYEHQLFEERMWNAIAKANYDQLLKEIQRR